MVNCREKRSCNFQLLQFQIVCSFLFGLISIILQSSSQLSFLIIIRKKKDISSDVWYPAIYIILIVPETINIVKSIWKSSILSREGIKQWPEWTQLLSGLLFSVVESFLIAYLATDILSRIPEFLVPALLFVILATNIFFHDRKIQKGGGPRFAEKICGGILLLVVVACLISTGVFLNILNYLDTLTAIFVCLFLIVLSFLRFVPLQKYILGHTLPMAYNASILYSLVRFASYTITLIYISDKRNTIGSVTRMENISAVLTRLGSNDLIYFMITHIVSAYLIQITTYMSNQTKRGVLSVVVPSLLSNICTVVLYIVFLYKNFYGYDFLGQRQGEPLKLHTSDIVVYTLCGAMIFVLCASIIWHIARRQYVCSELQEMSLRFVHRYSSIFLGQDLISNQIFPNFIGDIETSEKRRTRIYVCTTMYQEAKHEMDRLLKSINTLSKSKLLKKRNIYVESHIFLDNGANDTDVKDFGIQLLSLVERNFEMCKDYGVMLYTPYGIQLSWEKPNEMPLFIHLKDVSKVKAKKRWSQVMYMKYVLEFRSRFVFQSQTLMPSSRNGSLETLDVDVYGDTESQDGVSPRYLSVPAVRFHAGSNASSYSSLESLGKDLDKKDHKASNDRLNIHKSNLLITNGKNFPMDPIRNIYDFENPGNGLYTEFSYKFETKSQISNETLDDSRIFTINGSEKSETNNCTSDYILATDADMSFDASSVINLVDISEGNPKIGGVCGRTFPIGLHRHPIVWLQMFDYAKDFWMIKSAQNVIGSVMCCPGCFSLYRCAAVEDVLETYSEPTNTMEDVFTKDNGEDRWMCTLMMLRGWKLRYCSHGSNTTYCPEDTDEFMKQRRRWLLSDFANAAVVVRNIFSLIRDNTCFTFVYAIYVLQLFIVMILYPGSTIMMLALGFELVTSVPLLAAAGVLTVVLLAYSFILVSRCTPTTKLIISKVLIVVLGLLTMYIFIATSIFVAGTLKENFIHKKVDHVENMVLFGVVLTYIYSALLHPTELWILLSGIVYLFYLPLLNIMLPIYAVCNIVDQTWGTRDEQKATVPKILKLPKLRKRKKKSIQVKTSSYTSLSSSALDISETKETETEFWKQLVTSLVGKDVNHGISQEERNTGLANLRFRALTVFLLINIIWIILLCGFYAILLNLFDNKLVYVIVLVSILGLSPVVQLTGMTVYKISDVCRNIGAYLS